MLVLAVLVPGGYVFWRISDSFRYYMDDYLQFAVGLEKGLSWDLLGLNVFQHFGPVNRMLHLLVLRVGEFSLTAGMLFAAALVVVLQASLWWLLHELGISVGRTLLALVAVGFSVTVLDTAVWADAAFHIFPALIATNAVVAAHVRAVRTGRRSWHVISIVLFLLGNLTQERGLFALPMVVLADWFLLGAGRSLRERVRLLRSVWIPIAVMTAIALATAAFVYLYYSGGVSTRPTPWVTVRTILGALTEGIFPPWVGIRLQQLAPLAVQCGLLLLLVLLAAVLIWIRRRNLDVLAFFAASFLLYYGFLAFSPLLNEDSIAGTALRLHNGAYLLVPTVVAATSLTFRRAGTARPAAVSRPRRPWLPIAAAATAAVVLLAMGGRFTSSSWYLERDGHGYLATIARDEPKWSDPAVTVLPLRAPQTLAAFWAEAYGRHQLFLEFYRRGWAPRPLGDEPVVLDRTGAVRPVQLVEESQLTSGAQASCGEGQPSELRAPEEVTGEPLFLQLTYRSTSEVRVRPTSFTGEAPDPSTSFNWPVPLESGEHTVVIPLYSTALSTVQLDWFGPARETCVLQASVVRPVFAQDGQCTGMTEYGEATAVENCPGQRSP
jgi:hypothetical protein